MPACKLIITLRFNQLTGWLALACCLALPGAAVSAPAAAGLADWCQRLSPRLPGISAAACQKSVLTPSGAVSRNGFPILSRDIAASPQGGKAPLRVLLLGGIHGDELTASAIVFQWMQAMQGPAARSLQWKIAPALNPDGLLAAKPKRVNANGVDLNRNFPTPGWQQDAPRYWAKATGSDPRRFPGKAPLSEPESRWVSDTIESYKPDVIISVHAPFGVLDLDGPAEPPRKFGRLLYNRVGVYPGSLGNYSGLHKQVPVVTIELPNAQTMPPPAEVQRIWQDMLSWVKRNVKPQAAIAGTRKKAS
jgi:murein peptide amidase A